MLILFFEDLLALTRRASSEDAEEEEGTGRGGAGEELKGPSLQCDTVDWPWPVPYKNVSPIATYFVLLRCIFCAVASSYLSTSVIEKYTQLEYSTCKYNIYFFKTFACLSEATVRNEVVFSNFGLIVSHCG